MKHRPKQSRRPDLHEDSGRTRRKRAARDPRTRHRKRAQLIAQIGRSVQWALAQIEDEALEVLVYSHIELVDNASHLRVVMRAHAPPGSDTVDLGELARRLNAHAHHVRMDVAQDIHRKRVPWLSFAVVPG